MPRARHLGVLAAKMRPRASVSPLPLQVALRQDRLLLGSLVLFLDFRSVTSLAAAHGLISLLFLLSSPLLSPPLPYPSPSLPLPHAVHRRLPSPPAATGSPAADPTGLAIHYLVKDKVSPLR
ncbi:hypothetical protein BJX63DRAFT_310631 [Aspergillus granulosus]|uniref:Uncharacterized protein n=1 Tax=Aspergillus granulosus TaxID=176169 RepID=A0ABR4HZZ2_9EURO